MNGSPNAMFRAMADEWTGWRGMKSWQDLEAKVIPAAETDAAGHVRLTVELAGPDHDSQLQVTLIYEAGQLEDMAASLEEFFASRD